MCMCGWILRCSPESYHNVVNWLSFPLKLLSCVRLCDPMGCSLPGSSVHGIFQARTLEWVAISFFRGSSRPRDWTWVSRIVGRRFTIWATREALNWLYPNTKEKTKKYWNRLPFSTPGDLPNPGIEPRFSYVSCIGGQVLTTSTTWIFMYPVLDLFLSFQTLFPFQGSPSLKSLLNCPEIIHIKNHNRTTGLQQVKENRKTAGMLQG